ncbi:hypothetical protein WME79_19440 [Sorangium sp. So ce726]|uniref:hypothetical protein n=1 Tax=Sorangium sp. So ce726 TaxID=3133319 RepID=UPI003F624521
MSIAGPLLGIVITVVVLGVMAVVFVTVFLPMMKNANKMLAGANEMIQAQTAAANLRMTGLPAQARVLIVQPTGTMINYQPQCRVDLEVYRPNAPPYRAAILAVIHQMAIPRVQPGLVVPVKIDAANPNNIALDV